MTCSSGRPARHDLTIIRGDSTAIVFRFRTLSQTGETELLDLSECTMTLTVEWLGGELVRQSSDGGLVIDPLEATVTWSPLPADTLQIPDGRLATYRMVREIVDGERQTLLAGFIIGVGFAAEVGEFSDA